MSVKIKAFHVENFKKIKDIRFEPDDAGLFIIGGDNAQGKTSALDAVAWILGGAKFTPSNPKNENAIGDLFGQITLSNGLIVERSGKNGALKVKDPNGKRYGQELLNEFISALSLDLPKFLNASPKEKANVLLDTLGIADKLAELDRNEKILYDERTEIGRIALSLEKHANEMPYYADAPETEQSASEIIEAQQNAVQQNNTNAEARRSFETLSARIATFEKELSEFDKETPRLAESFKFRIENEKNVFETVLNKNKSRIEELKNQIESIENENLNIVNKYNSNKNQMYNAETERISKRDESRKFAVAKLEDLKMKYYEEKALCEYLPADIDLSVFKDDIEKMEAVNAKVRANREHKKASSDAKAQKNLYDEYTQKVESVRRERMELLASVKMPLDGLSIKDGELYYKAQKWDCMSGSERMMVGTSIVRSTKPECGFVLLNDLEKFDLTSLDKFNEWLRQNNLQGIAARVSKGNECSIIIEDGLIVNQ